jgi:hypothetical protein
VALLSRRHAGLIGVGALLILAIVGIAYFDFGPPLAFNDDYIYSWSARHLAGGHLYPRQTALALPQLVIGWLISGPFGQDQRALRASLLIVIVPGAWAAYRLAQRLGAGPTWSLLSPVVILTSPIFFNMATSFMSDAAYVGLLLLACNAGVAWLDENRGQASFGIFATLATLERVVGVGLLLALALVLVLRSRQPGRSVRRTDAGWLAAAAVGSAVAVAGPGLLGISAGLDIVDRLHHIQLAALLTPLIYLPMVGGYLVLPLAGALRIRWNGRLALVAVVAAVLVVVLLWRFSWLPGNIWTFQGPAPTTIAGVKPPPVPVLLVLVIIGLSPVVFWLLGPAASLQWFDAASDWRFVFLLATSGIQLLLLIPNTVSFADRYYLPVVAPLVPMLCALAQVHGRPASALIATVTSAALLGLAFVYEQDYQAWQGARDQTARLAYRCARPARVNAGYEANAVYVEIPTYESTGSAPPPRPVGRDVTVYGPLRPDMWLEYAGPDDSRPGVTYGSAAPGKIVIDGSICNAIRKDAAR